MTEERPRPVQKLINRYERRRTELLEQRVFLHSNFSDELAGIDQQLADLKEILAQLEKP